MSDVPIPSPALFPQNLAEPQGTEQTHVPEGRGLRLGNDPGSEGIAFEKGSVINLIQSNLPGDLTINPNRVNSQAQTHKRLIFALSKPCLPLIKVLSEQ